MKRKLISGVLLLVLPTLLFQCKKENTPSKQLTIQQQNFLTNLKQQAAILKQGGTIPGISASSDNPINKYNDVGKMHNAVLDGLKPNLAKIYSTQPYTFTINNQQYTYSKKVDKAIASAYVAYKQNESLYHINSGTSTFDLGDDYSNFESLSNEVVGYFEQNQIPDLGPVSPDAFEANFSNQMVLFQTNNSLTYVEDQTDNQIISDLLDCDDINTATSVLNLYENNIANSSGLYDADAYQRQLSFLSILSDSINYWYAVENDPTNPWWTVYGSLFNEDFSNTGKLRWWKWLLVGISDGLGGLTGFLFSSPIVGSFVAGAVGGVASGVVQDLLAQ